MPAVLPIVFGRCQRRLPMVGASNAVAAIDLFTPTWCPAIVCTYSRSKLIQSDRMWNDVTVLVRSLYPALLLLRLADLKTPAMDKLYFYVRQMDQVMIRSKELLDEMETKYKSQSNSNFSYNKMIQYFLQTNEISDYCNEFKILDELKDDDSVCSDTEQDNSDDKQDKPEDYNKDKCEDEKDPNDSDSEDESEDEEEHTLGDRVKLRWDHRKKKLSHDLSIASWMLSPVPDIMKDAYDSHDGDHRNAVERLLKRWIINKEVKPTKICIVALVLCLVLVHH